MRAVRRRAGLGPSVLVMAALACIAAQPPAPRRSADGVDFPDAIARRLKVDLPLIGETLGSLPEEVAKRVYHTAASRDLLRRRGLPNLEGWFAFGVVGSQWAALKLTDGRVTFIRLGFRRIRRTQLDNLHEELEQLSWVKPLPSWVHHWIEVDGARFEVTIAPPTGGPGGDPKPPPYYDGAWIITFQIHPIEWYLLHNTADPQVAEAMRDFRLILGMTKEEALAVYGDPIATGHDEYGHARLEWRVGLEVPRRDEGQSTYRIVNVRKFVTAHFRDGKIVRIDEADR